MTVWLLIGIIVVAALLGAIGGMVFGFHCGFVWGRYRISAYEFWKQGRTYD